MAKETLQLIQIIGYRPFTIDGKQRMRQHLFEDIRVGSVVSLFKNLEKIVSKIPEEERWNIHWTNANCLPFEKGATPKRAFAYQECIIFDLDGIDMGVIESYVDIVLRILRVEKDKTGVFNSGNGLHFVIALPYKIETVKELNSLKKYYSAVCGLLNQEFFMAGLMGHADPVRLAESATLRLPLTMNRKEGREPKMASVIQGKVEPQDFDLKALVGEVAPEEISEVIIHQEIDAQAVLSGCDFLSYSLANQELLHEPQWYAMIGILAFVPLVGRELCHTYSKQHPDYDYDLTEAKIDQALELKKPRKCASIEQIFDGCVTCKNYKKCSTPLSIKSVEFISTANTGFHTIVLDQYGSPKKFTPNYEDLVKYYKSQNKFVVSRESGILFRYNGKYWEQTEKIDVKHFATENFKPIATNKMREEFVGLLYSTNVVHERFFGKTTEGYINFSNCVLKIDGRLQLPHSPDYGFQYCLPYDFDPYAVSPAFDEMMASITMKDTELQAILLEFMAYAISNIPPEWGEKALVLDGNGSNGKSTFLDTIRNLVGDNCYSSVPLADLNDPVGRQVTMGKLFNICEETEYDDLKKAAMFKALVTGGTTTFKKLYHQPITAKFRAKLIVACNKVPVTADDSDGVYRRLLIIPFRNKYTDVKGNLDKDIRHRIFEEMSGIYNRVLDAYDRLIRQKGFTKSVASDEALHEYKMQFDVVAQFFDEIIETTNNEDDFLTYDHFREQFFAWVDRNNVHHARTMSVIKLMQKVKMKLNKVDCDFKRVGGRTYRGFKGLKIIESGEYL